MKPVALFLSLVIASTALTPAANAASKKTTVSFDVQSTPNAGESLVTFYGQVKPAAKAKIEISSFDGVAWKKTVLGTTASASGAWRITTVATAIKAEGQYRATAIINKKRVITKPKNFKVDNSKTFSDLNALFITPETSKLTGGRIQGSDVSRWQHPNDEPIDFKKKFEAGMRFVLIKGSD